MDERELRIVFAGGGSGGHLYPAIAIADEIREMRPAAALLFVGAKRRIEGRVIPDRGYDLETISVSGLSRRLSLKSLMFPFKLLLSLLQSFAILRRFRPHVVVGTGGYVSGPVVYVASLLGIPTLIQEQNSYPGLTTRLLAGRVDEVHLSFEETKQYLRKTRREIKVTGNPTRSAIGAIERSSGARFFGMDPKKKTLLVFGGSLGAVRLNDAVLALIGDLIHENVQVLWQTGKSDYQRIKSEAPASNLTVIVSFIDRMEFAYAASDLVICRAGATTLAEVARAGIPAILVPYPHAAANHQVVNAKTLADAGAAVLLREDELSGDLKQSVLGLLESESRRNEMRVKSLALGKPKAARELAEAVLRLARFQ